MKDRFNQDIKSGDTIVYMRSSGNYLELAAILEVNVQGKAKIVTEDGTKSTFDLTRRHRVIKTMDPLHSKVMEKVLSRALGAKMRKIQSETNLDFLKI